MCKMRVGYLILICALLQGGCALTKEQIALQYIPQQNVEKISKASDITVNVLVNDMRPDKSKVSSKKNGFGQDMAAIVAKEDVALTIHDAIGHELQARGFQLGEGSHTSITADVSYFYNDYKVGLLSCDAAAEMSMLVTVTSSKGKQLYSRPITGRGKEEKVIVMGGENARIALNRALDDAMKALFEDKIFLTSLAASR